MSVGRRGRVGGFTLVEILISVAVISALTSAGYMVVSSVRDSSREAKLESDVASVNTALQIYLANSGSIPAGASADTVLAQLKTRADAASAAKSVGLTGSFIDARIEPLTQNADQANSEELRAVWDDSARRFVLARSGGAGIREFRLNNNLAAEAPALVEREHSLNAATETQWIWDYEDKADTTPALGAPPTVTARPGYDAPVGGSAAQLAAPGFSHNGGSTALSEFDLPLTLSNPNGAGTSQIYYSRNGGPFVLYRNETFAMEPGEDMSAYAATIDPDRWSDSDTVPKSYAAVAVTPNLSVVSPVAQITFQQAGGSMLNQSAASAPAATVTLGNAASIPAKYLTSANFEVLTSYGAVDPLTAGTAGPSFSGAFVSPQIDLSVARWGSSSALQLNAVAKAVNTALFNNSSQASTSVTISKTVISAPTITPVSGQRSTDLPVTITPAADNSYPADYQIYYTTDNQDPGAGSDGKPTSASAQLYSGQFQPGAGSSMVISARAYGPAGYEHWFVPSGLAQVTYTTPLVADGALVGSATLNGTFVGSLIYATPTSGNMSNITFNSGAKIMSGNLYLPGTPTIRRSNGTVWSLGTDSQFSSYIQGWEYDSNNVKTVQTTPRVIDSDGSETPNNYSVTFNSSALLEGKVVRRYDSAAFPTIAAPPPKDSSGSRSLDSPPAGPISASQYANVTINTSAVGDVRLLQGNFGNLTANNGTAFVLGDPDNPDVIQTYSFESLNLNSSSDLKIVGKVVITVKNDININNGSVLGNSEHPDWLQLSFYSGNLSANSGSNTYAKVVAPKGNVTFNAGSIFQGSVTANQLTINSNGVVFVLPPVIEN